MIGKTISHYKIIEKLGEGGMGIVYLAKDTKLDRLVALKFLPNFLSSDANEKERFYHEARAAASLTHQNVAVIYEIGEYESNIFLAMEYVDGETLKTLVEQKSELFTIMKVLEIAIQICEGLDAAHEKEIVHRDIKSDNIMMTKKGKVKVMDFGLAKIKGASRLTQIGSTVGTAAYMSPEQAQGMDVDQRSDIFSFGVVLYEMLTTHLPFNAEHQAALVYSLINEDPQPVARFNDKVSQELEHIVFKALAKDKEERYQHIDDMLADLRRERKNLDYAKSGYIKASTISQINTEQSTGVNIQKNKKNLKIIIPSAIVILLVLIFFFFNPFEQVSKNEATVTTGNSLAVMYFENIPDREDKDHTGEMLTNLLITSLSQINGLEVISRERLQEIQKDLGGTDTKSLSPSLAGQVAKKAGVSTMLLGSILQKKPKLAVTTRLIDVQSGRIISSQRVTNFSEEQIFNLVDSLAYLLRNNLQVKSTSPSKIKSVAEVTTKSPEAYRAYVEGLDLYDKIYWKQANAAFSQAIKLDNKFAMAYYYLSQTHYAKGEVVAGLRSLREAVNLADKTTERERLHILATNYLWQNNLPKAIEGYEKLIELYPHNIGTYIELGYIVYNSLLLAPEKGEKVLRQGLKIEPSEKTLWNVLAYTLAHLNRKKEALESVNKYIKLAPAEPNPYDTNGDIYVWFQEYDSSRAAYKKAISLRRDFISAHKLGFDAVLRKQYIDAEKYFDRSDFTRPLIEAHRGHLKIVMKKLVKLSDSQMPASERLMSMVNFSYEMGQFSEMLRLAIKLTTVLKKNPMDKIYGRDYLAWALVKNGRSAKAHSILNEMKKDVSDLSRLMLVTSDYSSALVSFEEGNYELALEKFRKIYRAIPLNHEPNIFYGITLLKNGQIQEAIEEFQRLMYWPEDDSNFILGAIPGARFYWPIPAVKTHYWLGVAYEKQGNKNKALYEYKKFLDIWGDVDFKSHEVSNAKKRSVKLKKVTLK